MSRLRRSLRRAGRDPRLRLAGDARTEAVRRFTSPRRSRVIRRVTACRRCTPGPSAACSPAWCIRRSRRCADRGHGLRDRADVPAPRPRGPRDHRRRFDPRCAAARRGGGATLGPPGAVRGDRPPPAGLGKGAFDVVYSSGVLHHTSNPRSSFARLAQLARPGGTIVVGVYNAFARVPLRLRLRRPVVGVPRHPVRSGAARSSRRAGAAAGVAPRSVSASRRARTRSPRSRAGFQLRIASNICVPSERRPGR